VPAKAGEGVPKAKEEVEHVSVVSDPEALHTVRVVMTKIELKRR
jgi:hypothetical protein